MSTRVGGVLAKPVTAQKEWTCAKCKAVIPVGQTYLYVCAFYPKRVCATHAGEASA